MKIASLTVVSIHYTLTDAAGQELDSSSGDDPLKYLHGKGNIIPGLEKAMEGRAKGDKLEVEVQPEDGYGPVQDQLVQTVPRSAFQVDTLEPGMVFQASGADGETHRITVVSVEDDDVKIDANHPLAGQVLHFAVEVVDVRTATEEEIAHGHVH